DDDVSDEEWRAALGDVDRRGHRLSADHLHQLTTVGAALDGDVDAAVRRLASGLLDGLAVRIRPRRTWDDLVLPPHQLAELRDLCERYRLRDVVYDEWGFRAVPSAGLVALFAGASGTGKTMTAEVIAGDLGLDLYRVDLAAITSKWIGETEKNLERIFSAASAGNLVLFFDEADAVFGKRSEVKESNDRYANMEVSYLLQRLETYDGLVILATNLQSNIDKAFLRRVHVSVDFQIPVPAERRRIWERSLPPGAPVAPDLDLGWFAERFDIAGGNIRSAAVTAGFLAATANEPIATRHIVVGLHREIRKLGRLPTESLFGEHLALVQRPGEDQATA
ncbi:MAG TPA: ATP-binding protein, partial [Acidimicrobiales bacterium]|nr:ATP-binding protein [Acidimicrobiales bacterium]